MKINRSFRWYAFYISQFLWVIAGCFVITYPHWITYVKNTPSFKSASTIKPFNSAEDPLFFLQLSDVHVNHINPTNYKRFTEAVKYADNLNPELTVLTGDLADDFPYLNYPKYGSQQREDWELYVKITKHEPLDKWLEVAGNHDEFGVFSFDSNGHNYRKVHKSGNLTYEDFQLYHREVQSNGGYKVHLITINPYVYPSAHPPFVFWPRPSKDLLDRLENLLDSIPNSDQKVVFNHYPLLLYADTPKSSKGHNFYQLMTSGKVTQFLSGHLHPKNPKIMHHSNVLEVICPDLKGHFQAGVFTFDNSHFVYHTINMSKDFSALQTFVTYPVPQNQLTEQSVFNQQGIPIRVLSLLEDKPTIKVAGDINGTMTCRKHSSRTGWVCELPNNLEKGSHSIKVTHKNYSKTINFVIGDDSPSYSENEYKDVHLLQYYIQLVLIWLVLLVIVFPTPHSKISEQYDEWLSGASDSGFTLKAWIITVLGLPAVRFRVARLPKWIRILLLIAVLYPLCLPTVFMEIEGHIGIVWTWGYVCGGRAYFAIWGYRNTLHYLCLVVFPAVLLAGTLSLKQIWWCIPDLGFCAYCVYAFGYLLYRYVFEAVGFIAAPTSPAFIFWPAVLYISLFLWRIFFRRKPEKFVSINDDSLIAQV